MQELRSSEILDKEIHSDAVRKAEKILKKADADCESIIKSIETAVKKDEADKAEFLAHKKAAFEKDQSASIPLEKERFLVTFVQKKIVEGINNYLESIGEEKRLELVCKNFDFNIQGSVNAYVYGFKTADAKKYLEKKLGKKLLSCKETQFGKILLEDDCGLNKPEGIILESENKDFRCRLTLSQVISQLLDKNRAELSDALFGEQL